MWIVSMGTSLRAVPTDLTVEPQAYIPTAIQDRGYEVGRFRFQGKKRTDLGGSKVRPKETTALSGQRRVSLGEGTADHSSGSCNRGGSNQTAATPLTITALIQYLGSTRSFTRRVRAWELCVKRIALLTDFSGQKDHSLAFATTKSRNTANLLDSLSSSG